MPGHGFSHYPSGFTRNPPAVMLHFLFAIVETMARELVPSRYAEQAAFRPLPAALAIAPRDRARLPRLARYSKIGMSLATGHMLLTML